jgi:para-nitrobenzyl esterase
MTIVSVSSGDIQGTHEDHIHAFKGVPYAEPVGGRARWLPPQPRAAWKGVRDATSYGPACLQFNNGGKPRFPAARKRYFEAIGGSLVLPQADDSLLLNVWSPTLDRNARLPVMVYFYGGGFISGAANAVYDGSRFARKDVVAVVVQYRVGPPGFLHGSSLFEGELCADNRGFMDQILALQWVRQNISAFGGDEQAVTIFGESAGAFSVFQLAASPLAKGLFRRAIAMGGMPGTCAPAADYHALTRDVLRDVGVAPGDAQALIGLDKSQLSRMQASISKRIFGGSAVAERYGSLGREKAGAMGAATGTEFLPQAPMAVYPAGTPNDIDLLLGTCAQDGNLFSLMLPFGKALSARLFAGQFRGLMPNRDLKALYRHYRRQMPGAGFRRVHEQINNDAFYRMPTIAAAEAHAASHPGRTYLYQLDCRSGIAGLGAVHAIDVALLFRTEPVSQLLDERPETAALSEAMLDAWTSFARTGRPAASGLPEWRPYEETGRPTMLLDHVSTLRLDPDQNLRRYWRK